MGIVLVFIFLFAAAVSAVILVLSLLVLGGLGGFVSKPSLRDHVANLAMAAGMAFVFGSIGFGLYPSLPDQGAPTGDDYNRLAIKTAILGFSPGVGYLTVALARVAAGLARR